MTNVTPNLHFLDTCQHFPRYFYEEGERRDNISKNAVKKFRTHYNDKSISADKIFFYIYGLLHSKEYVNKYQNDLTKGIPRILMAKNFYAFSDIGRQLSNLHLNYESGPKYKGLNIQQSPGKKSQVYKVEKMCHPKKDKSTIVYNDYITIKDIPEEAHEYQINGYSAIRWIMERYRIKTHKESGIVWDPNREDDPEYILNLLKRVVYVSVESIKLINQLDNMEEELAS